MISNGNQANSNFSTFDYNDFRENHYPQPGFPYQYPSITNSYEDYFHKNNINYKCCENYEQDNCSHGDAHFPEIFRNHPSEKPNSLKAAEITSNNLTSDLKCLESLSMRHNGDLENSSNSSGFVEQFCEQYKDYDLDKQQFGDEVNNKSDKGI